MPRSSTSSSEPAHRVDLVLIGIIVLFVGTEIGLRLSSDPTISELRQERRDGYFPPPHVFDAELGYRYRPSHEGVFERTDFRTKVRTNGSGWRDQAFSDPASDTWRVALVGSSYLAANQVELDQIWASRLEAELGAVHGRRVELMNFGVDGYRPWNMHQLVTRELPAYEPDLVVLWSTLPSLADPDESYRAVDDNEVILEARDPRRLMQVLDERNRRPLTFSEALPKVLATTRVLNALLGKEVYSNYRFVGGQSATRHDPCTLLDGMRTATRTYGAPLVVFVTGEAAPDRVQRLFPKGDPTEVLGLATYRDAGLIEDRRSLRFDNDAHWTPDGHRTYAERTRVVWQTLLNEQLR